MRTKHDATLIGSSHSPGTIELEEFLTRNRRSFTYIDYDKSRSSVPAGITQDTLPVVICEDKTLIRPTLAGLAALLNIHDVGSKPVDLTVVGAGPGGLASAIYGASEGLTTLVVERYAPGGQAGMSSRIENYFGFRGSGMELASFGVDQAMDFGAQFAIAQETIGIVSIDRPYRLSMGSGMDVLTKAVVIATGAKYNRLEIARPYEGVGVYFSATPTEGQLITRGVDEVVVVGGGNSAGQAGMYLATLAKTVHILVRGEGLKDTMSHYLIERIKAMGNIVIHPWSNITTMTGADHLDHVQWLSPDGQHDLATSHVFLMLGARPNTRWLSGTPVTMDDKGFIITGYDLTREMLLASRWPIMRPPKPFETSLPGVFAIGDVRSGSIKRVASAVGEGSASIQFVHQTIQEVGGI